MKIFLFGKKSKPGINEVVKYLKKHCEEVEVFLGERSNKFPSKVKDDTADILISYISPWIIPEEVLRRVKLWKINFHPGPPEYPGIGCANFAIYNGKMEYGVTAHLMEKEVDTGKIIGVKRFRILETDTVHSLTLKSYEYLLTLFYEVLDYIIRHDSLPRCDENWTRKPYTRKQLEELCRITTNMSKQEIERRIKATKFPGMPGAYIEIYGYKFEYNENR
jgi:methionyl-tRNA formyltransferase